jgi:uncharacterized protein (TIGR00730 family)
MTTVCVLCGAQPGLDPRHVATAAELGTLLARADIAIVYGGSATGCMGALADAALSAGGSVTGVIPAHLGNSERRHEGLTRLEVVADLATRKTRMFELSSAIVALPGGTGTLDELLEAMTMKRLGLITHPLLLVDPAGFYSPLFTLLRAMVSAGFAHEDQLALLPVVDQPATALPFLKP